MREYVVLLRFEQDLNGFHNFSSNSCKLFQTEESDFLEKTVQFDTSILLDYPAFGGEFHRVSL